MTDASPGSGGAVPTAASRSTAEHRTDTDATAVGSAEDQTILAAQKAVEENRMPKGAVKAVFASSFGNLMEAYDNLAYGYLAVYIGMNFYPADSEATQLLASFATFAVGFIARPIGTMIFGHIGDRYGRKAALLLSVVGMAVVTTLIGLLPTHETIGVAAAVVLVFLRLCQGAAMAGEWAGSASLLVEYAPKNKRGFFGSWNQVSTAGGFVLAAGVVAAVSAIFDEQQMAAFGWRIPFLIGALTGLAAIVLRWGMEDTPAYREEEAKGHTVRNPILVAFKEQTPAMLKGFGFTVVWTVAYFFFLTYVPTFLTEVVGTDPQFARTSNLCVLVFFTAIIAPMGILSDRIGRKPLLLIGAGGFVVLSFPVLFLFTTNNGVLIVLGQVIIALILASFSGAGIAALSEVFPTNVRYSALGIGYNFAVMAFGGTAPFIGTAIVASTGVPVLTALLPTVAGVVTLAVVLFTMKETFRDDLR
ncbi:MFS transporter [Brevibacterium litoralis]|uniref:MFS transporter n=1 Tax=Brevibacterium litoralis TaxID=3138935 RepID=UPI0032F06B45